MIHPERSNACRHGRCHAVAALWQRAWQAKSLNCGKEWPDGTLSCDNLARRRARARVPQACTHRGSVASSYKYMRRLSKCCHICCHACCHAATTIHLTQANLERPGESASAAVLQHPDLGERHLPYRPPVHRPRGSRPRGTDPEYDRARGSAASRGYGSDWRKVRALFLDANPLCIECEKEGRVEAATQVDHVISIRQRPDLRLDESNLRALCASHHSARTSKEQSWNS